MGWTKLEWFGTWKRAPSAKPAETETPAGMPVRPGEEARGIMRGSKGALRPVFAVLAVALCLESFLVLCPILIT